MVSVLKAIVADPRPGPSVTPNEKIHYSSEGRLSEGLRKELQAKDRSSYDSKKLGWGLVHKYIDADNLEYSLLLARAGDSSAEQRARETLKAAMGLMDREWGGAYQYSTNGDWKHPHFEKIMSVQADDLRIYALAYLLWKDPSHRKAAEEIDRYLNTFLKSPAGAFYTSQDADRVKGEHGGDYFSLSDAERRKKGIPAIDRHLYSRENGWAIEALAIFYSATGEKKYLEEAKAAAEWVLKHRSLPEGGYSHGDPDRVGPYLGDTLAMGRAFFSLYSVTGDRVWLAHSQDSAHFIDANFRNAEPGMPGFVTLKASAEDRLLIPKPEREENIQLALWANRIFHSTGDKFYRGLGEEAMRYLSTPEVAKKGYASGVLLADLELGENPLHVTVVGHKEDPLASELFSAALRLPLLYRRIEWWDKKEGPLPNPDVQYPELSTAVAFVCTEGRCSSPIRKPEEMTERVERLSQAK
jgi:uncharacterized protein YyaL (SSP411 family)